MALRIVLAEDHQVVREGLRALLDAEAEMTVVGQADDGFAAVKRAAELKPDVVIIDVGLPGLSGIDAARRIKGAGDIAVLVLSMHDDGPTVERAFAAGVDGYVIKGAGIDVLRQAVLTVAGGGRYVSPEVEAFADADKPSKGRSELTQRELEVLKLVAEGHTGRKIAELLGISPKTVENHRGRAMAKLGVRSTAGLVRYAMKAGITR